jgi:hypothetical protein
MTRATQAEVSTLAWWRGRRSRYNLLLLTAAPISLGCLLLVWWLFEKRLPCLEITGFSLLGGAFLFLAGLALASVRICGRLVLHGHRIRGIN